ncbi:hypothetical protein MUP59_04315 [Candidatus Bathyarchaeota archaeon]|nr:hypothetical protein [Candidatus Bathyarchaeota archaeon]
MFEDIVEIWEVHGHDANTLLHCGWKILQVVQVMKSMNEEGLFHSKFVGLASDIVYVMGRTEKVPPRSEPWESVSRYEQRVKETTA